jgi:hypothetical protein
MNNEEIENGTKVLLADVLFYEKPQERKVEGFIYYEKNGEKYKEQKVYSIPCERCEKCPVYKIDNSVKPTSYYCQASFLIGIFNKSIRQGLIPNNCRVVDVRVSKNIR